MSTVIEYVDPKNPPPLTPEEIKMLDEIDKYPIAFDEDCPPLTEEQLQKAANYIRKHRKIAV